MHCSVIRHALLVEENASIFLSRNTKHMVSCVVYLLCLLAEVMCVQVDGIYFA